MIDDKFNACPFCGANNDNLRNIAKQYDDQHYSFIHCFNCGAIVYGEWNERPIEAELRKQIESLKFDNQAQSWWIKTLLGQLDELDGILDARSLEIEHLKLDNHKLMDQINSMPQLLQPNQEIIEWHECSEEVPTDSGHYLILCEDGDVFIDWYNNGSDEAGNPEDHCPWGDPEWRIEVQDPGAYKVIAWAYLPKGIKYEN